MTSPVFYSVQESPIGDLFLTSDGEGLTGVYMEGSGERPEGVRGWVRSDGRLEAARRQLAEYFAGERAAFDLPLRPRGTAFQRQVWNALREIPYGETVAYGEVAERVGRPGAARAVGAATGRNPIPIVVPCHRVVGADGSLVGFGGGLERKRVLLALEERIRGVLAGSGARS